MAQTKELREQISALEKTATDLDARLREILAGIPNLPHASVPVGHSAEDNVEVRRWGTAPKFDFTPKAHWDLGAELGVLDLERAVKLTGARFAVYWDLGAKLERALMNFMLDLHTREHGYTEVLPPYLVNSDSMYGTGQLPKFAADSFPRAAWRQRSVADSDGGSSGHESVSRRSPRSGAAPDLADRLHAMLSQRSRIVRERCARNHPAAPVSESGVGEVRASGAVLRRAREAHARCEKVLQKLGLHYRVVTLCTGDMGPSSAKTYDIEVWLPGQQTVPRNLVVLEFRVLPGAAGEHPLSSGRQE